LHPNAGGNPLLLRHMDTGQWNQPQPAIPTVCLLIASFWPVDIPHLYGYA
jgi:hypothetical protein